MNKEEILEKLRKELRGSNFANLVPLLDELEGQGNSGSLTQAIRNLYSDYSDLNQRFAEQKRTFDTLLDNLPGVVYRCENTQDWPFTFVSNGIEKLTGYTVAEFENGEISYGEVIAEDYRELVWKQVQQSIESRVPFKLIYKIVRKNGEVRWAWEQGSPIFDANGELRFLEGFITDITERIDLDPNDSTLKVDSINTAMIDRELKMVELKERIRELENQLQTTN